MLASLFHNCGQVDFGVDELIPKVTRPLYESLKTHNKRPEFVHFIFVPDPQLRRIVCRFSSFFQENEEEKKQKAAETEDKQKQEVEEESSSQSGLSKGEH